MIIGSYWERNWKKIGGCGDEGDSGWGYGQGPSGYSGGIDRRDIGSGNALDGGRNDMLGVTISPFLHHRPSLDSLTRWTNFAPSFTDALCLNPASLLCAAHGSFHFCLLTDVLLLQVHRIVLPASFYRTDHLLFMSTLAFPLWTPLGPCAGSPLI